MPLFSCVNLKKKVGVGSALAKTSADISVTLRYLKLCSVDEYSGRLHCGYGDVCPLSCSQAGPMHEAAGVGGRVS